MAPGLHRLLLPEVVPLPLRGMAGCCKVVGAHAHHHTTSGHIYARVLAPSSSTTGSMSQPANVPWLLLLLEAAHTRPGGGRAGGGLAAP